MADNLTGTIFNSEENIKFCDRLSLNEVGYERGLNAKYIGSPNANALIINNQLISCSNDGRLFFWSIDLNKIEKQNINRMFQIFYAYFVFIIGVIILLKLKKNIFQS